MAKKRSGSLKYGKHTVYWELRPTDGYESNLYMRAANEDWEYVSTVHPSIYSTAIRQYAGDYIRFHKGGDGDEE